MLNQIYLYVLTVAAIALSGVTLLKLVTEADRLFRDQLTEEDRSLAWRVVLFLILPITVFADMQATIKACEMLGGFIKEPIYGYIWYQALPAELPNAQMLIPVLFAGTLLSCLVAGCLSASLFFRPHPFFATVAGYGAIFIFALNLIVDPMLSLVGFGGEKWEMAMTLGDPQQIALLIAAHVIAATIFLIAVSSEPINVWFSSLTRPVVTEQLKLAQAMLESEPASPSRLFKVAVLFDRAGLSRQARARLKVMKNSFSNSAGNFGGDGIYAEILAAILLYRQRKYDPALQHFVRAAEQNQVAGELKGSLLAAAACSAFAGGDIPAALNLADRSLEFDTASLVARMVKVDAYLRQGNKEQAGLEVLQAVRMGLALDLRESVPLNSARACELLAELDAQKLAELDAQKRTEQAETSTAVR